MTKTITATGFWLMMGAAALGATSILSPAGTFAYAALAAAAGLLWVRIKRQEQRRNEKVLKELDKAFGEITRGLEDLAS